MKHITLCNCLCFSSPFSCDFASVVRNIEKFGAKNYFTDQRTANTIHGFRDSVPVLKIHSIRNNLSNFPFLFKRYETRTVAMYTTHSKQFSNTSNCMYLLILYEESIIVFLANVLVQIRSEISKIWLILWMVYTCNLKELGEVEKLGRLVEMNVLCIVDQDHQWWVIAVDHTSKFKVI